MHHYIKLNLRLGTNARDGNIIDECNKETFALNSDFEINDAQRELNQMNFLSNLILEDDILKNNIKKNRSRCGLKIPCCCVTR